MCRLRGRRRRSRRSCGCSALAYLYTEVTTDERGLGIFILPIIVALQVLPAMQAPGVEPRSPVLEHPAVLDARRRRCSAPTRASASPPSSASPTCCSSRRSRPSTCVFFFTRLPSLQVLDVMNSRTVFIGWLLMTVGLAPGALWVGAGAGDRAGRIRACRRCRWRTRRSSSPSSPGRSTRSSSWRGARSGGAAGASAYLSAVGFAIVLLNFVPVSYFLTDSHNFGG